MSECCRMCSVTKTLSAPHPTPFHPMWSRLAPHTSGVFVLWEASSSPRNSSQDRSMHRFFWSAFPSKFLCFFRKWVWLVFLSTACLWPTAILSPGMTHLATSWPGSSWLFKQGHLLVCMTEGKEPCFHGSKCVGAGDSKLVGTWPGEGSLGTTWRVGQVGIWDVNRILSLPQVSLGSYMSDLVSLSYNFFTSERS